MANFHKIARVTVVGGVKTYHNYGVSDIAEAIAVKLDTSNTGSDSTAPGIVLTSSDANPIGVTMGIIKAGQDGLVQKLSLAVGTASATIHVGDVLMTDSAGKLLPQTAAKYQIGFAESEAVSGDPVAFTIAIAKNA